MDFSTIWTTIGGKCTGKKWPVHAIFGSIFSLVHSFVIFSCSTIAREVFDVPLNPLLWKYVRTVQVPGTVPYTEFCRRAPKLLVLFVWLHMILCINLLAQRRTILYANNLMLCPRVRIHVCDRNWYSNMNLLRCLCST